MTRDEAIAQLSDGALLIREAIVALEEIEPSSELGFLHGLIHRLAQRAEQHLGQSPGTFAGTNKPDPP